jgi:trk system potassium uptake protein TrkH
MYAKHYNAAGEEIPIKKVWCGSPDTTYVFWGNITPVRDSRTGEIIHEGVEAVGRAVLFWRSFLQWVGGVGIILLFASILPALGVGGKVLLQAEQTGPLKSSLTPRLKETAAHLWKIYFGWSVLQVFLLMWTNEEMPLFDAVTITFSTLSTGGFSVKNASIGAYQNEWTEWIIILFMIVGSINFTLYFYALSGRFYRIYDLEFFLYMAILAVACAICYPLLIGTSEELLTGVSKIFDWGEAVRLGTFQVVSAATSTGFATANFDMWPYSVQALMLIMMFVGGMSGSTAGGIKIIRHYLLFRIAQNKVESLFQPEAVRSIRVGERDVDSSSAIMVLCFFLVVIASGVLGTFIYILIGLDPETALGAVGCMLNNTGLAFRMGGPLESFAFLSNFGLIFSSILMILGRLEFFAVLAILVPAFWKNK